VFVSAISPSLRPHLATSDLPCYCKKLKFLHVACIVGSRVRVQAQDNPPFHSFFCLLSIATKIEE